MTVRALDLDVAAAAAVASRVDAGLVIETSMPSVFIGLGADAGAVVGPPGPTGPAGATGATGPTGATGATGPAGMVRVNHGATASTARPHAGDPPVLWVGTVTPSNADLTRDFGAGF